VKNPKGDLAVINWKFNAWAKYDNWRRDDQVPQHIAKHYDIPQFKPEVELPTGKPHRLVLEGGSIDTNGAGLLLTTEECLLSKIQERNPGLGDEATTRKHLEQAFHYYLGIEKVLWLHKGCAGDDTHGHIDDITRFVGENKILTCVEPNTHDENHLPLAENLDRLRGFRNLKNKPFEIVELPMPSPVVFEGQRLPASYANFYIANSLVLVPTFNDCQDRHALNIIASCFPTREVIGIHAVDLVWGLGTLHCLSQQEPA
jgi:agmatine deiminase